MTDSAIVGAVTTETSTGANAGAATTGSTVAPSGDVWNGLQDEGNRQYVQSKGWKDLDSLVKSAKSGETGYSELQSKALVPPAADATQEQRDAFFAKLGRPEKPDGYEFALPKDLPENLPYDGDSATKFKAWSHEAGLTPVQAQILHDRFMQDTAGRFTESMAAQAKRSTDAEAVLDKVWGDKASEARAQNVQHADRFIRENGGDALLGELKSNGLLSAEGAILSPVLANAMAKAGKALYAEDGLATGARTEAKRSAAETHFPPEKDVFRQPK